MTKITDPALLAQLQGGTENTAIDTVQTVKNKILDPDVLAALEGDETPSYTPEQEASWKDRLHAVGQGLSLGFSDEIIAGVEAAWDSMTSDENFSSLYDESMQEMEQAREAYEQNYPIENLSLNVLGGLLTGGVGAGKVLTSQAVKNAPKLTKALAVTGVGATEGGIAGMGAAKQDESLLEKGAEGALIGGILPHALTMAGKAGVAVPKLLTNRRVTQDLVDEAGNFTPYPLAADKASDTVGRVYRKIVAPSAGGAPVRDQAQEALDRLIAKADEATASVTALPEVKKGMNTTLRKDLRLSAMPDYITPELRRAINSADGQEANVLLDKAWEQGFRAVKGRKFEIDPQQLIDDVMDELNVPQTAEYRASIANELERGLSKSFKPFKQAPDIAYSFNPATQRSVKNPDVDLPSGEIDGDWLMQARNNFNMDAARLADESEGKLRSEALRTASDKIDSLIDSQLRAVDPKLADSFAKDKSAWGSFRTLTDATKKAVTRKQGLPEAEDILQAGINYSSRRSARGTAPAQKQAQTLQRTFANIEESAKRAKTAADDVVAEAKLKMPARDPANFETFLATGLMSAPYGMLGFGALPAGITTSAALARPSVQRFVAGQTKPQMAIADAIRKYEQSVAPEAIRSSINRAVVLNQQDEEQ